MELNKMGKAELRALCKEKGVKGYGKMTNGQMREAVQATQKPKVDVRVTGGAGLEPGVHDAKVTDVKVEKDKVTVQVAPIKNAGVFDCMIAQMNGTTKKTDIGTSSVRRTTSTAGFKIEKDREVRNGIKRPSAGGLCRAVWDALDAEVAAGRTPTVRDAKSIAVARGWNENNASIEYYIWRRFRKE